MDESGRTRSDREELGPRRGRSPPYDGPLCPGSPGRRPPRSRTQGCATDSKPPGEDRSRRENGAGSPKAPAPSRHPVSSRIPGAITAVSGGGAPTAPPAAGRGERSPRRSPRRCLGPRGSPGRWERCGSPGCGGPGGPYAPLPPPPEQDRQSQGQEDRPPQEGSGGGGTAKRLFPPRYKPIIKDRPEFSGLSVIVGR